VRVWPTERYSLGTQRLGRGKAQKALKRGGKKKIVPFPKHTDLVPKGSGKEGGALRSFQFHKVHTEKDHITIRKWGEGNQIKTSG